MLKKRKRKRKRQRLKQKRRKRMRLSLNVRKILKNLPLLNHHPRNKKISLSVRKMFAKQLRFTI